MMNKSNLIPLPHLVCYEIDGFVNILQHYGPSGHQKLDTILTRNYQLPYFQPQCNPPFRGPFFLD